MKSKILYTMKNKLNRILLLLLVSLTVTSCVSIKTTSYSDPDFIAKKYNNVCIYSVDPNLNRRATLEEVFVYEFADAGIRAVEGSKLFPPTRDWVESDFQTILKKNGFDAFIKIEVLEENINETVVPQYHTNTETQTIKKKNGKDVTVTNSNTYVTEDRNVYMNNQFQAELIDVETNRVAWKGYSSTNANLTAPGIDVKTIMEKFAESVLEELKVKGHLKVKY